MLHQKEPSLCCMRALTIRPVAIPAKSSGNKLPTSWKPRNCSRSLIRPIKDLPAAIQFVTHLQCDTLFRVALNCSAHSRMPKILDFIVSNFVLYGKLAKAN